MIEKIKFKMSCGEIYGFLYLPDNITGTFPIVILSHGLSLNHTYMKSYAEKLLKYNIASFIFDFRGGGYGCLSSGKISDMTLNSEVTDLMSVIDFIKSLKKQIAAIKRSREWEGRFMLLKEMLSDERAEGLAEGKQQTLKKVNKLNQLLAEQNRMDDIIKAANDSEYQEQLFKEFNL